MYTHNLQLSSNLQPARFLKLLELGKNGVLPREQSLTGIMETLVSCWWVGVVCVGTGWPHPHQTIRHSPKKVALGGARLKNIEIFSEIVFNINYRFQRKTTFVFEAIETLYIFNGTRHILAFSESHTGQS